MKVFTVRNGNVSEGAAIEKRILKGAGVEIDAILVGEEGRGRELGVLPVQGAPADGILRYAVVGQTKAGKPKLIAQANAGETDACIVVFRTKAGFRGGARHTGDRHDAPCPDRAHHVTHFMHRCDKCLTALVFDAETKSYFHPDEGEMRWFDAFPGEIICEGRIAQGDAGYMGGNEQIVAIMPADIWFRTRYTGRLYGAPESHYYKFDGERLIAVTWEERQVLEEAHP